MKKIALVAVLAGISLGLTTGCGGSNDSSDSDLVGLWTLVTWRAVGTDVPGGDMTLTVTAGQVAATIDIKSNGTIVGSITFMGDTTAVAGTWSVSGNTLTILDSDGAMALTFSVSGNTLTLSFDEEDENVTSTLTLTKP